ncbi:Ubiquitin-like superfamily protein [Striga hermonthica]|uniref:Ubiquitin-like superfamily protein n=1 Tax=Striga hermonthica TaxID=68872 RepID=A0A9N7NZ69_STRHE|nr:Ubiquitin-like superfamily protein [Striga hermonthica]
MDDLNEEFEPLFDYTRIQPTNFVCLDDDSLDESPIIIPKKRKTSDAEEGNKLKKDVNAKDVISIDCDGDRNDKAEDWMPPPLPKDLNRSCKILEDDPTLKALRLKRQELASFTMSADELVRAVEESVKKTFNAESQSPPPKTVNKEPLKPPKERSKLVISIQDKEGHKQFRVYKDDKFERLFKMYADRCKLDVKNLVFCFDGDKVSPSETPDSLGMEDDDIIEVHVKSG